MFRSFDQYKTSIIYIQGYRLKIIKMSCHASWPLNSKEFLLMSGVASELARFDIREALKPTIPLSSNSLTI